LIIAHNPGLENLLRNLSDKEKSDHVSMDHFRDIGFTTAGLALLEFSISNWSQICPGIGEVKDFKTPDLIKNELKGKRHASKL